MELWPLAIFGVFAVAAEYTRRRAASTKALERERAVALLDELVQVAVSLESLPEGEFLQQSRLQRWIENTGWSDGRWDLGQGRRLLSIADSGRYEWAKGIVADPAAWGRHHNKQFTSQRLAEIAEWAEGVMEHPLTSAQQLAMVRDEDVNLIVAGAGTGKTSTILGKVSYLLSRKLAEPSDILVLAFNKKVAREVREKLSTLGHPGVSVSTFHSKAFSILGVAEGGKPPVSALATSEVQLEAFLQECLDKSVKDDEFMVLLNTWWVDLMVEWVELEECKTKDERLRKEGGLGLVSLTGIKLASVSEVKVANALSLNGVAWEYEKRHPKSPKSSNRRDYTPDFYLPEHEIWLEVWGCWKKPRPVEFLGPNYRSDMEWKKQFHKENDSILVEVYQDDIWAGDLNQVLRDDLTELRVVYRPIDAEARGQLLALGVHEVKRFVLLVAAFLRLKRGGGWKAAALHEQATTLRDRVFLNLFDHFEQAYEGRLADEGKIDFEEMLLRANEHLERKAVTSDLRYILVDEFQDVSHLRMIFLELLRSHTPEARLFLVGDDWQSIYRFTGSDLNLFIDAESRLGSTARTDLDRTFRLESDILDVSTRFVTRNPSQLKKTLQARVTSGVPGVSVRYFEWGELGAALKNTLEDIAYRSQGDVSVLVLARYTHVLEDAVLDADWAPTDGATVKLHYSTVHRAKGLEADHVVVLSVESGIYGFPSEIHDDRVLRLVTHGEDDFENAEERRLFYVALTRTRGRAYVLAPANHPSGFVQELLGEDYSEAVEVFGEKSERFRCPLCHGMTIRQKSGKFGTFWSCIHHPRCKGRLRECDACHEGVLEPRMNEGRIVEFRCTGCEACVLVCPSCRTGALPRRMGSRGEFLACSNWRKDGSGCGYTRDA